MTKSQHPHKARGDDSYGQRRFDDKKSEPGEPRGQQGDGYQPDERSGGFSQGAEGGYGQGYAGNGDEEIEEMPGRNQGDKTPAEAQKARRDSE